MKIKTETITFSIWSVILFSRILISQDSSVISSPLKIYYISSALLIVFAFFQWIRNSKKLKLNPILFWGSSFGVYVFLFGKILVNNSLKDLTEFMFNALVIFYILVFIMASYIKDKKCIIMVNFVVMYGINCLLGAKLELFALMKTSTIVKIHCLMCNISRIVKKLYLDQKCIMIIYKVTLV